MTTLQQPQATESYNTDMALALQNVTISYGNFEAVKNVYCEIPRGKVTAFIGPSGCGKSTVLRSLNRMNDLIEGCSLKGSILFGGVDLYGPRIDPVEVRRRIGMVFQQPNPFPKSIYENIAFGARINGYTGDMDELVERSLRQAAVWDECKDKLNESGYSLSGGQQQRLCIARTKRQREVMVLEWSSGGLQCPARCDGVGDIAGPHFGEGLGSFFSSVLYFKTPSVLTSPSIRVSNFCPFT